MKYNYPEIQGKIVDYTTFSLARAKSLALAIVNNPEYIFEPTFIKRDDGCEIILVTLDIEIFQKSQNGIQENEDIAIICHPKDENFPEVFALRENFQLGLPHTNLRQTSYPVSLCISEQNFQEVKHTFNPFFFIENIRQWLSLTSQNKLHSEDQPLEPFFIPKGFIILPDIKKINLTDFYIEKVGTDPLLYKIQENANSNGAFYCITFNVDAQTSGFIRQQPQKIKDITEFIFYKQQNFAQYLAQYFNKSNKVFLDNDIFCNKKLAICCIIPVKRHNEDTQAEKSEILFFTTQKTIHEIGLENNIWTRTPDNSRILSISEKSFTPNIIEQISIDTFVPITDFDNISASLYNNIQPNNDKFILIGAGALGSQVLELYARMGYGTWDIIDFDTLFPHNLARHALGRESIGCNKADSLSKKLNTLLGSNFCRSINEDFINISQKDYLKKEFKNSTAIIDISTSIAVERLLARDYENEISTRRISAFMNPRGNDLILLAEDNKRKYRLDFLEMEYYRFLYRNESLHDHLQIENNSKIRYVQNSCRDVSSKINQTNVALLSSICAKAIKNIIETGNAEISIWHIDSVNITVQKHSVTPTKWEKTLTNNWKIYLNKRLLEEMNYLRTEKLPKETGGVLIGSIDMERKIIYLFDTIPAPIDSEEKNDSFKRGIEGVLRNFQNYQKITNNQVQYLGEWHSHPSGCSIKPSTLDTKLLAYLSKTLKKQSYPTLMCILGDKEYNLILSE